MRSAAESQLGFDARQMDLQRCICSLVGVTLGPHRPRAFDRAPSPPSTGDSDAASSRRAASPADGRSRRRDRRGSWCRNGNRVTPRSTRSSTCSAATAAAISLRVAASSSSPSKRSASQRGTAAPAALGEILHLLEVLHRQDARHDRDVDAARAHPVEIAEIEIVLEEELRDRARRAGIDLGLEHVDVGVDASGCPDASPDRPTPTPRCRRCA